MSTARLPWTLPATLALAALAPAGDGQELAPRLEELAQTLETARVDAHVPGMSIAVVKDGEVVWARGFGLADVAAGRPADAETIYAIGSTTKAFTATLVGMLVDEGKMGWDDPVTRYLPYFDLPVRSEDADAECTLRDLLSHRHGFTRMGILWFGNGLSRERILRTAAGAEPWGDFREDFHYCNIGFLAAGEAAGVAGGGTWDELLARRILEPLGMTSSTLSVAEAQKDPRLAVGYEWEADDETHRVKKMVRIDNVGPAGSVNSNVRDMAEWLRLLLGEGEVDGERLVSAEVIRETWSPWIEIGGGASYGLGWVLHERDGRKVVEHGGNIDGFSAEVALMPEERLGFVLLMNLDVASLQQAAAGLVFDALLGKEPAEESAASTAVEVEDYAGIYVANFATFEDEEFEVLVQDGRLTLDVPSQMKFALKPPDEEGRWQFAMTDQIAVTFQRDAGGAVVGLTMHQGGFCFEVPRKGVEVAPETPLEELEKYTGTYVRAEGGRRDRISIERGGLVLHTPNGKLPLRAPDAEGHAPLRAREEWGPTFHLDAEGNVESYVFRGEAGDQLFTRLPESPDAELPTLEQVLALRKTEARVARLAAAGGTRITGRVRFVHAGVEGALTIHSQGEHRYATHMDFGDFGFIDVAARDGQAWSSSSMRGLETLKGEELTQALLGGPGTLEGDWRAHFDSIAVVRNDEVDGRPVVVVRLTKGELPGRTYWIDAETGDVLVENRMMVEGPVRIPTTVTYSDFVESDGIRDPRRVVIENPMTGRTILDLESTETGLELGDETFTLTEPEAGEAGGR